MSVELTDDQYLDLLLQARGAQKGAAALRRKRSWGCGTAFTVLAILTVVGAFLILTANQLGYIPPSLYGAYIGTPQTVFGTPQTAPQQPATSQQRMTPFYAQPGAAPAVEAAPVSEGDLPGMEATATPMPTEAPYVTQPNVAPSSPDSNPGFSCGVEPGMPADATCEAPTVADPEQEPVDVYSVEGRAFQPAVLPTSSTADNPGYDASVEPWDMPTPIK